MVGLKYSDLTLLLIVRAVYVDAGAGSQCNRLSCQDHAFEVCRRPDGGPHAEEVIRRQSRLRHCGSRR
jgi:hypothetical protein